MLWAGEAFGAGALWIITSTAGGDPSQAGFLPAASPARKISKKRLLELPPDLTSFLNSQLWTLRESVHHQNKS